MRICRHVCLRPLIGAAVVIATSVACDGTSPISIIPTASTPFEPAPAPHTNPPVQIILQPEEATITVGQRITVRATVIGGDEHITRTVQWSSAGENGSTPGTIVPNENEVTVSGAAPGVIVVTASHPESDARAPARITVVAPEPPPPPPPPPPSTPTRGNFVMDESIRFDPQLTLTAANVDFLFRSMVFTTVLQQACGVPIPWRDGFNAFVQLTGTGAFSPRGSVTGKGTFPFVLAGFALRAEFTVNIDTDGVEVIRAIVNASTGEVCVVHQGHAP